MIKIKKLHPDAVMPKFMTEGAAGMDITAIAVKETHQYIEYKTGLAISIPKGYAGLLFQRSSVSNMDLMLSNAVGVIDSDYRGEITFRFRKLGDNIYKVGDRIGQLVVVPFFSEVKEVDNLEETKRGDGGYGSTN